jgi:hypothetical protein
VECSVCQRAPASSLVFQAAQDTAHRMEQGRKTAVPKIVMNKNAKIWRLTPLKVSRGEIGIEKFDRYTLIIVVPIMALAKAVIVLTSITISRRGLSHLRAFSIWV